MFSTQSNNCTPFVHTFDLAFLFVAELEEPKIGLSGKGLTNLSLAEKIEGKGENASNQYFLPFPQCLRQLSCSVNGRVTQHFYGKDSHCFM